MKNITQLYILAAFPFCSFFFGYILISRLSTSDKIETPNLTGKNITYAVTLLSSLHLNPRIITQKIEPDLPNGTVLDQTPSAHTYIKKNQSIYLVVSEKPAVIAMPSLTGCYDHEIQPIIQNLGLYNKIYYLDTIHKKNYCIGQYPQPNTPLHNKRVIAYYSSGKQKSIIIPQLKGKSLSDVIQFFTTHALRYSINHKNNPDTEHTCTDSCIVTDQRPLAYSIAHHSAQEPLHIHLQVTIQQ